MLTTTHLAVAVLLGMLMSLSRDEWFAALTFGVLLDADHLFALPRYVGDNGWAAVLNQSWDDGSGNTWKSLLHLPVGAFVVAPLSVGWRLLLPLSFWSVHVGLDYLQLELAEYNTAVETAILLGSVAGITLIGYRRWAELEEDPNFEKYVSHLRASGPSSMSRWARSIFSRSDST
jgi:hypothetical protein